MARLENCARDFEVAAMPATPYTQREGIKSSKVPVRDGEVGRHVTRHTACESDLLILLLQLQLQLMNDAGYALQRRRVKCQLKTCASSSLIPADTAGVGV